MGSVYEGVNERIGRRVAIKVLHPEFAKMAEIVERFEREARAAAEIGSDHIVDVLDLGELPDGERYLVMEFLEGKSLADLMVEKPMMPAHEITPIAVQILRALDRAHAAGIVHRDLKPDNVYLAETPHGVVVKLLDFGVSKFSKSEGATTTQVGYLVGTPAYMAPEQARGETSVDARADLHSVGVMLYQAVSGELPRWAENAHALLFKVAMDPFKPLRTVAPHIDARFAAIVERAMASNPEERTPTAAVFEDELQTWLGRVVSSPTLASPPSRLSLPGSMQGASIVPPGPQSAIPEPQVAPTVRRDRARAMVGLGATALAVVAFAAAPRVSSMLSARHVAQPVLSVVNAADMPQGEVEKPASERVDRAPIDVPVTSPQRAESEPRAASAHHRGGRHPAHPHDHPAVPAPSAKGAVVEPAAPPLPAALEAETPSATQGGKMRAKL